MRIYRAKDYYDMSYFYFMAEHLFDKVNIDFQNVNIPNGNEKRPLLRSFFAVTI